MRFCVGFRARATEQRLAGRRAASGARLKPDVRLLAACTRSWTWLQWFSWARLYSPPLGSRGRDTTRSSGLLHRAPTPGQCCGSLAVRAHSQWSRGGLGPHSGFYLSLCLSRPKRLAVSGLVRGDRGSSSAMVLWLLRLSPPRCLRLPCSSRVASNLTRSWCGPAASAAALQFPVLAGRTARR